MLCLQKSLWIGFLCVLLGLGGCSSQPRQAEAPVALDSEQSTRVAHPQDPFESWNRRVFAFNEVADRYFMKPVARGYRAITPRFVRTGVGNFFFNLREIPHSVNNLLQGKPGQAGVDLGRFTVNSTLGLLGVLDVATPLGLSPSHEDFGQTLNVWGVPQGPYIVWPFLGGQTLTHTLALPVEYHLTPLRALDDQTTRYALAGLYVVHLRHEVLDFERLISGDRYHFIRDVYLQRRTHLINDGRMDEDPFLDDDFSDFDFDDAFAD